MSARGSILWRATSRLVLRGEVSQPRLRRGCAGAALLCATVVSARLLDRPHSTSSWITLGTSAGPIPNALRSQPANLLRSDDATILVDAGDGAAEQLARAHVPIDRVQAVIISHLHFDHTAGLFAIIALRQQMLVPGTLAVYGPVGTRELVEGILIGMKTSPALASREASVGSDRVSVTEIGNGSKIRIGGVVVTAIRNSHYSATPDGQHYSSLSFRFDLPERSIGYTGDTGPSAEIDIGLKHVDLLVSEILDSDRTSAMLARSRPDMTPAMLATFREHFTKEHLSPTQAGLLAKRTGAKALVLTHNSEAPGASGAMETLIRSIYSGPVTFARDLDSF